MENYIYNFEKLEVWNIAIRLSVNIYRLTNDFPREEKFGIISQLRRASSSISANIAEGTSRISVKDKARFIQISYGSAIEVLNFLILSQELGFMKSEDLVTFRKEISELTNKLNAFHKSILKSTK
jgi:four helix bundle protein